MGAIDTALVCLISSEHIELRNVLCNIQILKQSAPKAKMKSKKRPMAPVLILGMHRSGTSCLAGSLQQHGLFLGDVVTRAPHNLKGNREHIQFRDLNDSILEFNDGAWDDPPPDILWTQNHLDRAHALSADIPENTVWGFKDPRTLITLPFWQAVFPAPTMVASFRAPLAVARSLGHRNGFGLSQSTKLWKDYNERLLALCRKVPVLLVDFDAPSNEYQQRISAIRMELRLQSKNGLPPFREDSLINQGPEVAANAEANRIHQELLSIYRSQSDPSVPMRQSGNE